MGRTLDIWIPTRRSLLERLKNWDDSESWREFLDTYGKLIYGVAVKAGLTGTEAEEVVQETTIVVSKKMKEFRYDPEVGSFKGWLLRTTRWRVNDQFRKRRREVTAAPVRTDRETRTSPLEQIPDPAGFDLEKVWDQEWEKHLLEVAFERVKRRVKAKQYQLFDLYVIKQWPVQRIAQTLGVSTGRIYLAKYRVSALVKEEIRNIEKSNG